MDLSIQLGSDYLHELNLGGNAHYTSEQTVRELLQTLSSVIEEGILEDIQSSEFFALTIDESTDIAVLKQLVLVARCVMARSVKTAFMCIPDLQNGTAQTTEAAILQCLADNNLDVTRVHGFGSDGASVMTGRVSGVAMRLKNHSPRMISGTGCSTRL